jgi:hypothetical protein
MIDALWSPRSFWSTSDRNAVIVIACPKDKARVLCAGAALCSALLVGGCESYLGARTVTVHGKHGHKTCTQLLAEHKATSTRIDELSGLISKAEQEAAGTIIGAAVYGPTLAQARGERRILDEAIEEKRCR